MVLLETGRTGDESAVDGLADYLEEHSQGSKLVFRLPSEPLAFPLTGFVCNGNAACRAESVGFELAGDFLFSIVIPDDLMTA
jgi:hypothetical protein